MADPTASSTAGPDAILERCCAVLAERPDDAEASAALRGILSDPLRLKEAVGFLAASPLPARAAALGMVHQILGETAGARAHYRRALAQDPAQVVALRGLSSLAASPQEIDEATELLRRAALHNPDHATILADLGAALYRAKRYRQALPLLHRAIGLDKRALGAARQCFYGHQELGEPERARAVFATHLCRQRDAALEFQAATLLPPIPESTDHIAEWRQRFARNVRALAEDPPRLDDPATGFARSLFLLAYHGLDDRDLRADLARLYRRACPALGFTAPHCRGARPPAGKRIRVGVVSSFFYDHTIGKLNIGLVEKLPRDRFEVTLFAVPAKTDALIQRYRNAADRFVALPAGLWDARAAIADAAQDMLFYPEIGMEAVTYMLAFARLAPLQLTTWGHPETTGIDTIDAFLSSEWLEPAGAERCYGERLVRLEALPARPYAPAARRRFDRQHFGLPEDARLYACQQTLFKFHPSFDPMLAGILARDDKALLVLLEGPTPAWAERLAARFRRCGIDVERKVRFLPPMPLEQYLSLCRVADVVLDTPVFGGGNSTYEAFHQDAVVVTLEGEFLRGRISAGMYRKMGLDDLIPADAKAYVEMALRVANEPDYRAAQRRRIAERRDLLYERDDSVRALAAWLEEAARG
jgi:predicted O-linked N-acetylglucosamine transferase (SPINDLY family)